MTKKQDLINRIEKLTDKQFELLISLFNQEEQEIVQSSKSFHQASLKPCQ